MADNYAGIKWVRELGYPDAERLLESEVETWWDWYRAEGTFYAYEETSADNKTFKVERISFNPARMVCEDWAGVLFNFRTTLGLAGVSDLDDDQEPEQTLADAFDWLQTWAEDVRLFSDASSWERAFGLGTVALVPALDNLRIDGLPDESTQLRLDRYDARTTLPLSWGAHGCTEAAFVSSIAVAGKKLTQWCVHTLDDNGNAVIRTAHFNSAGVKVEVPGYASEVNTGVPGPLFALISPEVEVTYDDAGPLGVSIFDAAIGAIKLADGSFDNAWRDIFLGQKLLFIPEEILGRDNDGNVVVPRAKNQQLFMAKPEDGIGESTSRHNIDEYNPDLRTAANRESIDTALALLGKRCGFGMRYYSLSDSGDPKTAKEVGADNADLMRNAKKHEQAMGVGICRVAEASAALAARFCGVPLPDLKGQVRVIFGDTIIQDEDTERERMRADVAAGLVPAYKYVMTYYGVDRETALEWTDGDNPDEFIEIAEEA